MRKPPRKPVKQATVSPAPTRKTRTRKAAAEPPRVARRPAAKAKAAGRDDACFSKVSDLCLALPNTKLTMTWGHPHFRVGEKIFCGFGVEDGKAVMGVKLELAHARRLVKEPRFWPAPYVGKHGWVSMDVAQRQSWDEVAALIRESYRLVAPKRARRKPA